MNRGNQSNPVRSHSRPGAARRWASAIWALALAGGLAGCQAGQTGSSAATPPAVTARVEYLFLQVMPVAADWDGRPGPDGLELSAMLFQSEAKMPVLGDGTMEFAIYEGILTNQQVAQNKPFYQWRFTTAELSQSRQRTQVGWGYAFRLGWGDRVPRTGSVTLTARFVPKDGQPVYANPVIIPMGPQ